MISAACQPDLPGSCDLLLPDDMPKHCIQFSGTQQGDLRLRYLETKPQLLVR